MEFLLFVTSVILGTLLRGWVISKLWIWFIVPFGTPQISLPHALGVALILSFASIHQIDTKTKTKDDRIAEYVVIIFLPLLTLLMGWIYHSFM
jgi:hypothetical protein